MSKTADGVQQPAKCPDCGSVGMDDCERALCSWDQWDDGTRVTAKQRADGAAFSDRLNALLAAERQKEVDYRAEISRWLRERTP